MRHKSHYGGGSWVLIGGLAGAILAYFFIAPAASEALTTNISMAWNLFLRAPEGWSYIR